MSKELHLEVGAGVAWLTVDRPEVRNALSAALCREIADRLNELALDTAVRVVVLRGAGEKVFVSGADINEFTESLASPQSALDYDANAELMQTAIRKLPKPAASLRWPVIFALPARQRVLAYPWQSSDSLRLSRTCFASRTLSARPKPSGS